MNPGLVSGRESVRRLPTPRTFPGTRKGLGAHLNVKKRRDRGLERERRVKRSTILRKQSGFGESLKV